MRFTCATTSPAAILSARDLGYRVHVVYEASRTPTALAGIWALHQHVTDDDGLTCQSWDVPADLPNRRAYWPCLPC